MAELRVTALARREELLGNTWVVAPPVLGGGRTSFRPGGGPPGADRPVQGKRGARGLACVLEPAPPGGLSQRISLPPQEGHTEPTGETSHPGGSVEPEGGPGDLRGLPVLPAHGRLPGDPVSRSWGFPGERR